MPIFLRSAPPRLRVAVHAPRLRVSSSVLLSREQQIRLGALVVNTIKDRLRRARNVLDRPAKPLKPAYAAYKRGKGARPVRDWYLSGRMLSSLTVTRSTPSEVVVGLSRQEERVKLAANQRRERMFGLSPSDRRKVTSEVRSMIFSNFHSAFSFRRLHF